MAEEGFELRSWASNNAELKDKFNIDNTCSTHGSDIEKLLGYDYSKSKDTLSIHNNLNYVECDRVTKRIMLANIAKVYDPLGLALPVTVSAKIFKATYFFFHHLDLQLNLST